jgi:hypothetical protein
LTIGDRRYPHRDSTQTHHAEFFRCCFSVPVTPTRCNPALSSVPRGQQFSLHAAPLPFQRLRPRFMAVPATPCGYERPVAFRCYFTSATFRRRHAGPGHADGSQPSISAWIDEPSRPIRLRLRHYSHLIAVGNTFWEHDSYDGVPHFPRRA